MALLATVPPAPASAAFPGQSGLIAFVRGGDIFSISPTGSGLRQLTSTGNNDSPSWSPDGKKIAFTSTRNGNWDIFLMTATGSGVTAVTTRSSNETDPAWSPDGRQLAFASDRYSVDDIYRIKSTAPYGTARRLTVSGVDADGYYTCDYSQPTWGTPGDRIIATYFCISSGDKGASSREFNAADGSGIHGVAGGGGYAADRAPKAQRIVVSAVPSADDAVILRVNTDGTGAVVLTETGAKNGSYTWSYFPAWSPDGGSIVWAYDPYDAPAGIYVMKADGSRKHLIVSDGTQPDWQPLPA